MKKTLLILGGIALLMGLLFARLVFRDRSTLINERHWFAHALRYEFSAQVDSVRMFNQHTARLWCRITAGDPQTYREDSLKRYFKKHDMLYLIFHRSGDSIIFIVPNGELVAPGDSVRVSSQKNTIQFFRAGKHVAADSLSAALTGFGRPFFMKKD
ncbi:MAG: hypothetical protein SH819_05420 [Cytophagales bacterium]|nr:hypothetical protein [Cytophagales bacterium]